MEATSAGLLAEAQEAAERAALDTADAAVRLREDQAKANGETLTAGMAVYYKSADSRWWKAQADGTVAESGNGTTLAVATGGHSVAALSAHQPTAILSDLGDTDTFWRLIDGPA